MKRDLVVGIVGAAVLVAGMVGVFAYERNLAGTQSTQGTGLDLANVTIAPASGTVQLGKSDEKLVNITHGGFTNVTFTLTWKATNGKDTLKLTVAPPAESGLMEGGISTPSDSGTITVTVQVPATTNATGAWKVKVDFTQAQATTPVQPPATVPGTTDTSVAWSVATKLA